MTITFRYITMRGRGPRARVVAIFGCGQAPALSVPGEIGRANELLAA